MVLGEPKGEACEVNDNQVTMTPTPTPTTKLAPTTTEPPLEPPPTPHATSEIAHLIKEPLAFSLQGWARRILFVLSFEALAITCSSIGLSLLSEQSVSHASVMGFTCSAIAVTWNWLFNWVFESWEARQSSQHRTIWRRMAHAIGFEVPLLVSFVLLFAWWFNIGYAQAFIMDLALFLFFLVFTFLYTWGFDMLFGQPHSKIPRQEAQKLTQNAVE